eukprot:scaffold803_cov310-Pinguiococcus_pyrenoidosus.AAC.85
MESHGDGHLRLGHRVHRRRHDRQLHLDLLGDVGLQRHVLHAEVDVAREEDEVVVRVARASVALGWRKTQELPHHNWARSTAARRRGRRTRFAPCKLHFTCSSYPFKHIGSGVAVHGGHVFGAAVQFGHAGFSRKRELWYRATARVESSGGWRRQTLRTADELHLFARDFRTDPFANLQIPTASLQICFRAASDTVGCEAGSQRQNSVRAISNG